LINLQNSFTSAKSIKFPTKPILGYLLMVEQKISTICTCRLHFWSDFWQDIIGESVSILQAYVRTNGGHFEHILWTNSYRQLAFFHVFWFKWLLPMVSDFYCVDAWWSI